MKITELDAKQQERLQQTEQQILLVYRSISLAVSSLQSGDQIGPVVVKMLILQEEERLSNSVQWLLLLYTQPNLRSTRCVCVLLLLVWLTGKKVTWWRVLMMISRCGHLRDIVRWSCWTRSVTGSIIEASLEDTGSMHGRKVADWETSKYYKWYSDRFISSDHLYYDMQVPQIWCHLPASTYSTIDNLHNCLYTCCYHHVCHIFNWDNMYCTNNKMLNYFCTDQLL